LNIRFNPARYFNMGQVGQRILNGLRADIIAGYQQDMKRGWHRNF
jgi:hypothetical protein